MTQTNIERVRTVIGNVPWYTYDEIDAGTALFHGTIQTIIRVHLKMRKLIHVFRWVPHDLPKKSRRERIRMCQ